MNACALSLRYTLAPEIAPNGAGEAERPRFVIEPDAGDAHQVRFTATHLRSIDRLDVKWSSVGTMSVDPVKAYLAKIGARGGAVGGKAKTEAKAKAVRANGRLGGRPKGAKDAKPRKRRAT